ncbi:ATP-dependent helicase rhp16 [Amborella trichopoda]|uniref:ATP-dependent helicase rhp16 n=1 Tax=Amborella trichopoda TaxID=13333 RepID=UPI0009BDF203|nr:ATP-dependent helicase rhp16 [Amborella trichopoda]|eukprot:XP_020530133.1 ATP-dependent helicase rhp16 [Amborella trichopoda]
MVRRKAIPVRREAIPVGSSTGGATDFSVSFTEERARRQRNARTSDSEESWSSDSSESDESLEPKVQSQRQTRPQVNAAVKEEAGDAPEVNDVIDSLRVPKPSETEEDLNMNRSPIRDVVDADMIQKNPGVAALRNMRKIYRPTWNFPHKYHFPRLPWEKWEEENIDWLNDSGKKDIELDPLAPSNGGTPDSIDPSPEILVPLFQFQREWLSWSMKQEESEMRGGILADEMGMGKTLQAISLVLKARKLPNPFVKPKMPIDGGLPRVKGTLVVCPLVAINQWKYEIYRFTAQGSNTVLIYHGTKRFKDALQFSEYDFILTTYSMVVADYRKNVISPKPKKQTKKLFPASGPFHLHSVKWERIILDEAHCIKDSRRNTAKAVFALESSYKWALSGTPFQKSVEELYSLIRFLQIEPYAYHYCKYCSCKLLDHRCHESGFHCENENCGHSTSKHFRWWNKYVAKPASFPTSDGRQAMFLLKYKILKSTFLRRTKKERAADLALPPKNTILKEYNLDNREEEFYQPLYSQIHSQFNTYITEGTLMNNYAHIFYLLTRLRQAIDHQYLVVFFDSSQSNQIGPADADQLCGICHDPVEDSVVTSGGHTFCQACFLDFTKTPGQVKWPSCSESLTIDLTTKGNSKYGSSKMAVRGFKRSGVIDQIKNLDNFQTSTKIEALKEEIFLMYERDAAAKAIVFSQFSSFLDLISFALDKEGVRCIQLVGSMSLAARDEAIKTFTDDPDCRVFLMSLKAGGMALNLTVASHVFLMDPWWNPAVEQQAQD